MTSAASKPLVLLAFANDRDDAAALAALRND